MLGCDNTTGYMQTKWDGAPAIVCGKEPLTGLFFVGNVRVFLSQTPKFSFEEVDVDIHYPDGGELNKN